MYKGMSPHKPPRGPHCGIKIKRPLVKMEKGIKLRSCDFLDLYNNICGRINSLNTLEENKLEETNIEGKNKSGVRTITLTPNFRLTKIRTTDLICIPWGVKPNTWTPPTAPNGTGPTIWVDTPSGEEKLIWDGDEFIGDTITIGIVDGTWQITGAVIHDFGVDTTFVCQPFPTGYAFLKASGPTMFAEIINIDEQQDHLGRTSHYYITVERLDQRNVIVQE
jgi:hypothetical protein